MRQRQSSMGLPEDAHFVLGQRRRKLKLFQINVRNLLSCSFGLGVKFEK